MEKIRTLIVDDEPIARRGIRQQLRTEADVEIIGECANGREAVAAISKESPDLVFLDVQMPLLDGFTLLRVLRSEPELEHITVVLVSAGFPRGGNFQTNPPADVYLRKPFDVSAVESILDQLQRDA